MGLARGVSVVAICSSFEYRSMWGSCPYLLFNGQPGLTKSNIYARVWWPPRPGHSWTTALQPPLAELALRFLLDRLYLVFAQGGREIEPNLLSNVKLHRE